MVVMLTGLSNASSGHFHSLGMTLRKCLNLPPDLQTLHLFVVQLSLLWLAIRPRNYSHTYVHELFCIFQLRQILYELGACILF
jgi:hypothetical protein